MINFKRILIITMAIWLLVSCAADSDPLKIKGKTAQQVYMDANTALNNKTYDKSIKLYMALEATYPYGIYAQQGLLDLAYAHYQYDEYEKAIATINQFINTYPTSPNMDYALYLKGYVNYIHGNGFFAKFIQQDPSELDSQGLSEAYKAFTDLITNYPCSKYVADAKNKINEIVIALAKEEIIKARYYMGIKAYIAAINRANTVITTYSMTYFKEEALAIEEVAYKQLGGTKLYAQIKSILLLNYPKSKYLKREWVYTNYPWYKIY